MIPSLQDVKQHSNGSSHDSHSSHGSLGSVSDRSLVDKDVWQDIRRYAAEMWAVRPTLSSFLSITRSSSCHRIGNEPRNNFWRLIRLICWWQIFVLEFLTRCAIKVFFIPFLSCLLLYNPKELVNFIRAFSCYYFLQSDQYGFSYKFIIYTEFIFDPVLKCVDGQLLDIWIPEKWFQSNSLCVD